MNISDLGLAFMKSWETLQLAVYLDQGLRPTVGWGHLVRPGEDFSAGVTQDQADALFIKDLSGVQFTVNGFVTVKLSQNQYDACVSLCYNIGCGAFKASHLLACLNSGNPTAAGLEFIKWDHVNHVVSPGLRSRREAETEIFLSGAYVNHV